MLLMHSGLHRSLAFGEARDAALGLDLAAIPYSVSGSYLTLSPAADLPGALQLSTVRKTAATYRYQTGASWSQDLCTLQLAEPGTAAAAQIHATTERIELVAGNARLVVDLTSETALRCRLSRGQLTLVMPRLFSWRRRVSASEFSFFDGNSGYQGAVTSRSSVPLVYERVAVPACERFTVRAEGECEVQIAWTTERDRYAPATGQVSPEVSRALWMRRCPEFRADRTTQEQNATRTAWFLFWNLQVVPSGGYGRRAILSSKRSLSQVWSWDNLFNARAVVDADGELAWDQIRLVLDHQLPDGLLPDTVSDAAVTFGFNKPPLWARTIVRLLASTPVARHAELLANVYPHVVSFHRWWFRARNLRGDGVPVYLSGNDSGWDNASIFAEEWPVQSPDLLALLILDAEGLAELAAALGRRDEAEVWRSEAKRLMDLFLKTFVREERLVYFTDSLGGWQARESTSLLTRVPLLLGSRLPAPVVARVVSELRDPGIFNARCGPASEALSSKWYESNGYWRGPVWGPSTLLVCEALAGVGERELARQFANRYRETCAEKADFRENYDARSGAGQYDTGMTWAAADYLLLGKLLDDLEAGAA